MPDNRFRDTSNIIAESSDARVLIAITGVERQIKEVVRQLADLQTTVALLTQAYIHDTKRPIKVKEKG